jgi:putative intracellular protease/amidase
MENSQIHPRRTEMSIKNLFVAVAGAATLASAADTAFADAAPLPVLMVIANQDFYYQEYSETRASLEREGMQVVVAAATTQRAIPHGRNPRWLVHVDRTMADADASDYSAVVFVGGWGASAYQYAFEGTYHNAAYRADPVVARAANELINEFVAQDKYVAAICHGVSVLAYARVDGVSPLAGRVVTGWAGGGPGFKLDGQSYPDATVATRWHVEKNDATMPLSASAGDPLTVADDVIVDGKIITAENFQSARLLGQTIAAMAGTR